MISTIKLISTRTAQIARMMVMENAQQSVVSLTHM